MKNTIKLPSSSGASRNKITSRSFIGGFTLIEMMVVIAIIAILSGIIMANLSGAKGKARDSKRISDLGQIQMALSLYFDRCDSYPSPFIHRLIINTNNLNGKICPKTNTNTGKPYDISDFMSSIPTPTTGSGQTYYDYATNDINVRTDYVLHASLESPNVAVTNGLSIFPSSVNSMDSQQDRSTYVACSNLNTSTDYCLGPK